MTITGYQFDKAKVTASKDAALYNSLSGGNNYILDNQGDGLSISISGMEITVKTGMALICGRLVEVTSPEVITIPQNVNGFLVISCDLTKTNEVTGTPGEPDYEVTTNQVSILFKTSITQQDLSNGGLVHDFVLGKVSSSFDKVTFTAARDARIPEWNRVGNGFVYLVDGRTVFLRFNFSSGKAKNGQSFVPGYIPKEIAPPDNIKHLLTSWNKGKEQVIQLSIYPDGKIEWWGNGAESKYAAQISWHL